GLRPLYPYLRGYCPQTPYQGGALPPLDPLVGQVVRIMSKKNSKVDNKDDLSDSDDESEGWDEKSEDSDAKQPMKQKNVTQDKDLKKKKDEEEDDISDNGNESDGWDEKSSEEEKNEHSVPTKDKPAEDKVIKATTEEQKTVPQKRERPWWMLPEQEVVKEPIKGKVKKIDEIKTKQPVEPKKQEKEQVEVIVKTISTRERIQTELKSIVEVSEGRSKEEQKEDPDSSLFDGDVGSTTIAMSVASLVTKDVNKEKKDSTRGQRGKGGRDQQTQNLPLFAQLERLDQLLMQELAVADPHTPIYVERLQDESILLNLAQRIQTLYETSKQFAKAATVAAVRLEHLYYKTQHHYYAGRQIQEKEKDQELEKEKELTPLVRQLAQLVRKYALEEHHKTRHEILYNLFLILQCSLNILYYNIQIRAILCLAYHLAACDYFEEAKNILLATHMHELIPKIEVVGEDADVGMQILYNRAIAQLGMSAFRKGNAIEAHSALNELCSSGKVKELLGQAQIHTNAAAIQQQGQQQQGRTAAAISGRIERERLLPFHMHINYDALETVQLTSAMLVELPQLAQSGRTIDEALADPRRKLVCLQRGYRGGLYSVMNGPAETNREQVFQASQYLMNGEWKEADKSIRSMKVWSILEAGHPGIQYMVSQLIREGAFHIFVLQASRIYDSISLQFLAELFNDEEKKEENISDNKENEITSSSAQQQPQPQSLSQSQDSLRHIRSKITKLILQNDLPAAIDTQQNILVYRRQIPSYTQRSAILLADKVSKCGEGADKLWDAKAWSGEKEKDKVQSAQAQSVITLTNATQDSQDEFKD
ncbi:MAG: putative Eukaryotic translation initiation factor 3 subunit C, partial [Streblomastix strix]